MFDAKKIFPIGIGTFPFDEDVWGPINEKDAISILLRANERGVNYFNSAYYYGKGRCESILGQAVKKMKREDVIVATKIGTEFNNFSLSKDNVRKSINSILKRMDLEYIDVLIIHKPDPKTPLNDTLEEMLKIKEEGLIKEIGLSNFPIIQAKEALKLVPISVCEFYFSLLTRDKLDILDFCDKNSIVATPYKVVERGLLTEEFLKGNKEVFRVNQLFDNPYTINSNLKETKKLTGRLNGFAKDKGLTLAQLAIAWVLHQGGVTCPLIGVRDTDHLEEDIQSKDIRLSEDDLKEIEAIV